MPKVLPFRLSIDHARKCLRMRVEGASGQTVSASMDIEQIGGLMAILSHCQHALVRTLAGVKTDLPIDPQIAFKPVAGKQAIGAYEGLRRIATGVDDNQGLVSMLLLSVLGRLSEYRMSPEMARHLGQGLIDAAENAPAPRKPQ